MLIRLGFIIVALATVALVGLAVADRAEAQTTVTLAAMEADYANVDFDMLALIASGHDNNWYTRGRFGSNGTLTGGDLGVGPDNAVLIRVRDSNGNGANIQMNHGAPDFLFSTFFPAAGSDLSLYIRSADGTVILEPGDRGNTGGGFVNFGVDSLSDRAIIAGIDNSDNFIVGLGRPGNNAPVFLETNYTRSVDENSIIGVDVGAPITAVDADNDVLGYSLSGTGSANFNVSAAGQITTAVATLDHETTETYILTLTADDGNNGTGTATVTININDVEEVLSLTPDPEGQTWDEDTNQEFTISDTPGIMGVRITETEDTGNITLHTTEAGLSCSTQTDTLLLAPNDSFWVRFCEGGAVELRVEDRDDSTNGVDYTVTIDAAAPVDPPANNAPVFSETTYERAVNENVAGGTNVGAPITATDADNDTLTYLLRGGDAGNFLIFSSGQIRTATTFSPDAETDSSYTVTIVAQDGEGGEATATVNITINDLADTPTITPNPNTTTLLEHHNYEFQARAPPGIQTVVVKETPGSSGGDITLHTSEEGIACDNPVDEITIASDARFWIRACADGSSELTIEDDADANAITRYDISIGDVSPPAQVTGLTGDAGDQSVILDWTAPNNNGGPILRYEYSTFTGLWRTTGSASTGYTVTEQSFSPFADLANGTQVIIRVRAVNAAGAGTASSEIRVTPRAPSAPGAPTGLQTTPGSAQIALSWTAPSVDHDETITSYDYSTDDGTTWRTTGGTGTTYTVTQTSGTPQQNLANGTDYTIRVRAVNSVGAGAASSSSTASPSSTPGTVTGLTGSAGDASVTLNWTAPNDGGSAITRYEYTTNNGTNWRSTGSTSTSYTATRTSTNVALVNDTDYTFRVRAVNANGTGGQSNAVTVAPNDNAVPGQVTGVVATPGDGFIDLVWSTPGDGGQPILHYEYRTGPNPWESTGSTNTSFRVTRRSGGGNNLVNGVVYGVQIRAVNSIGAGPASDIIYERPNNQPPAFANTSYTRSVAENSLAGTDVGSPITATDPEGDTINYQITGSNPGSFNVNSSTGQIETGQLLDREDVASYTITLRASATGGSGTTSVTINVTNVNEGPSFASASYSRSIAEDASVGDDVGSPVTATDPEGDSITYSLSGSSAFRLGSGGQIEVASALDRETQASYSLTITATSDSFTDTATVNVTITNVIEDPEISSAAVDSGDITRTGADVVATLSNPDFQSATIHSRYRTPPGSGSWTTGPTATTASTSGTVSLTGLTANTQYRVQLALDSAFTTTVQADFTTSANSAPSFASASLTLNIDENSLAGRDVGQPVTASDADGDTLTYSLSGTDAGAFDIDDGTGQITVGSTTSLDFETKASYSVTVTATDTHGGTDTITVTIEVNDLREAGVLGRIVVTLGSSGSNYGYDSGSYGTLDSGEFPGDLFDDGNSRSVAELYEDAGGYWYFTYSGGAANGWLSSQAQLDDIVMEVSYENDEDLRSFVLGGFIDSRSGTRSLKLDPPLPSRDWDSRSGEEIAIEFFQHSSQQPPAVLPAALGEPTATAGTIGDLINRAPGTGVDKQMQITLLVVGGILALPKTSPAVKTLMMVGGLVVVPWAPAVFGNGSYVLSSIVSVIMLAASSIYRVLTRSVR